jgi:hypothetical protein
VKRGVIVAQHSGSVAVLKWIDKCSNDRTYRGAETESEMKRGKEKENPVSIIEGVDLKDQLLQPI